MRNVFGGMMALALLSTSVVVRADEELPFEIDTLGVKRSPDGGCAVTFQLVNKYPATLKVSGTAIILDDQKTTYGDAYVSFSPAIPGGKSFGVANFYAFKLAGGSCPKSFEVILTPSYCSLVEASRRLSDRYCKLPFSATINPKPQPAATQ